MPISLAPASRRRFLAQSVAAFGLGLSARFAGAQEAGVENVWALLSDTHIDADPGAISREVNMATNLKTCIAEILAHAGKPAGVILSGDCAHLRGLQADYETFKPFLQPLVEASLPVHLLMGNHDDRGTFAGVLKRNATALAPVDSRYITIQETPVANWFLLDSLIKVNDTPGRLGESQLSWLSKELDARADKPAIIVVHHNVVTVPAKSALQDSQALLDLLRPRRQVKACVFGHTHRWEQSQDESGLHLINLPPTSYVFKPEYPNGWVMATLQRDAMQLELRCLDVKHAQHGEVKTFQWRS